MKTISVDDDIENADWTKQSWDLPPYLSADFFSAIGGYSQLEHFRTTQTYKHAVARGLILDDEWVGDAVQESSDTDNGSGDAQPKAKHVHIHINKG